MGYTVHQLGINLMPHTTAFLCRLYCRTRPRRCMVNRGIPGNSAFQQFRCLADSVGYLAFNHLFPIKPLHRHLCVRRHNDAIGFLNILCRQHILCTAGTPCFDFHITTFFFGRLLNPLCRHIGMGYPRRAGSDCQNFCLAGNCRTRICQPFINASSFFIRLVDNGKKFIHASRITQVIGKPFIHH